MATGRVSTLGSAPRRQWAGGHWLLLGLWLPGLCLWLCGPLPHPVDLPESCSVLLSYFILPGLHTAWGTLAIQ